MTVAQVSAAERTAVMPQAGAGTRRGVRARLPAVSAACVFCPAKHRTRRATSVVHLDRII